MREHIFLTSESNFELCHKHGLYGTQTANQLALVSKNDRVVLLVRIRRKKETGVVAYGPYYIASEGVFYSDVDIKWNRPYPYRVKLTGEVIKAVDGGILSRCLEKKGVRIDSLDLRGRSVHSLLPLGVDVLLEAAKESPEIKTAHYSPEDPRPKEEPSDLEQEPIDLELCKKNHWPEHLIEFILLRDKLGFFGDETVWANQFRTSIFGDRLDALGVWPSQRKILLVEIKKKKELNPKDLGEIRAQLRRYAEWAKHNIENIGALFGIDTKGFALEQFVISRGVSYRSHDQQPKIYV